MLIGRREFLVASTATTAYALFAPQTVLGGSKMFGLIGSAKAIAGKRDELIRILVDGVSDMPGCLSYIVAKDPNDQDGVWITEVWDSKESHAASLKLPQVQAAIAKGKPLFASFGMHQQTEPVGGHGLSRK